MYITVAALHLQVLIIIMHTHIINFDAFSILMLLVGDRKGIKTERWDAGMVIYLG